MTSKTAASTLQEAELSNDGGYLSDNDDDDNIDFDDDNIDLDVSFCVSLKDPAEGSTNNGSAVRRGGVGGGGGGGRMGPGSDAGSWAGADVFLNARDMDSTQRSDGDSTFHSFGDSTFNSSSTPRSSDDVDHDLEEIRLLVHRESRSVRIWRRNVYIVIFLVTLVIITLTYWLLQQEDKKDFETAFQEFALAIQDSTKFNLRGVVEGTRGLSEVLSAEAVKTNSQWPFMTLSSFEVYVRNTRTQASSELVVITPIVSAENLDAWADYSTKHQDWIDESFSSYPEGSNERPDFSPIPSSVYRFGRFKGRTVLRPEDGAGDYPTAPFWQMSRPPFDTSIVNFNSLSTETYKHMYDAMLSSRRWVMGVAGPNTLIDYSISQEAHDELHSDTNYQVQLEEGTNSTLPSSGFANYHPHTALVYPVFEELSNPQSTIVAMVINILPWDNYLKSILPDGVNGIHCILHNDLGQSFTYIINGNKVSYEGRGDFHDREYDDYMFIVDFNALLDHEESEGDVAYWFAVYPTNQLESDYLSNTSIIFVLVACGAAIIAATFILYDRFVTLKNTKVQDAAARSNAMLSSLFPRSIKQRLLEDQVLDEGKRETPGDDTELQKLFEQGAEQDEEILRTKPIADVHSDVTVMFADLAGFTAWSSSREPTAVFVLLETLYRAFDKIAKKRKIYKVETIGDCYVAVAGLPEPRRDHALAMGRFAKDILRKACQLTKKLEVYLGPDTGDLNIRIGLHSGPVTAGVLRGERSRYQLFGSTMNIGARIEGTGEGGRIHLSQNTADHYFMANKGKFLEKRNAILMKGVGEVQTYWLKVDSTKDSVARSGSQSIGLGKSNLRIQWNVECFSRLLKQIAAGRDEVVCKGCDSESESTDSISPDTERDGTLPLEEVKEVIDLPTGGGQKSISQDVDLMHLDSTVQNELEAYITWVEENYADLPFHNFDHASHVILSVCKLMSRFESSKAKGVISSEEFGFSNSFLSDPLVRFACAFSALVHDTQHPGIGNQQLVKEDPKLAAHYKGRSVAEQRSFDIAWGKLMSDEFCNLRAAIYKTRVEEERFRQLVINCIMSTDIMDKELKELRNTRWEKAFSETSAEFQDSKTTRDRKATIMLEHLIQASDVAHTMQHWAVYRKWNMNLFHEMYEAYQDGRLEKDPTEFWYKGEIGFLDFYVIPLAERLKEVGQYLGVPGDEYVEFAKSNRREWEEKGEKIVEEMKFEIKKKHPAVKRGVSFTKISMDGSLEHEC